MGWSELIWSFKIKKKISIVPDNNNLKFPYCVCDEYRIHFESWNYMYVDWQYLILKLRGLKPLSWKYGTGIPLKFAKLDCTFIVCRNDPKNFFNSPQELMDAFKEIVEQRIEPKLLNIFHTKPSSKLEIVEVTLPTLLIILDCSSFFLLLYPLWFPQRCA